MGLLGPLGQPQVPQPSEDPNALNPQHANIQSALQGKMLPTQSDAFAELDRAIEESNPELDTLLSEIENEDVATLEAALRKQEPSPTTQASPKEAKASAVKEMQRGIMGATRLVSRAYATATLPLALPLALGAAAVFGPQLRKATNDKFNAAVDVLGDHATSNPLVGAGKAAKILATALTVGGIKEDAKDALGIFRACGMGMKAAFSKAAPSAEQVPTTQSVSTPPATPIPTPEEIRSIPKEQLGMRIKTMTGDQIKELSVDQVKKLSDGALYGLKEEQLKRFTKEQLLALNSDQFLGFQAGAKNKNLEGSPAGTYLEIRGKSRDEISSLDVKSLSPEQLQYMTTEQVNRLTADQIKELSTDQIRALSTLQVFALSDEAYSALENSTSLPDDFEPVSYHKSMQIAIPAGETSITLRGNNKTGRAERGITDTPGEKANITLTNPVRIVYGMNFPEMDSHTPAACLVMSKADFELLKDVVHDSAFGGDFRILNDDTVVLWKYPADLNAIAGLTLQDTVKVACGTYPIVNDANRSEVNVPSMTKVRTDFHNTDSPTPSVHILLGEDQTQIPAMGTGNLFEDFYHPTPEELRLATNMLENLGKLGIQAFSCGETHHLFVFHKDSDDNPLTPEKFAEMLNGENGRAIIDAIKNGTNNKEQQDNIEAWAKAFISHYGPK